MTYGYKSALLAIPFLAFAQMAHAGVTDVVQAPTGYFVPTDALKGDPTYYRGKNDDWGWTQDAITGSFTTATLLISAYDVDYGTNSALEHDAVYAYDNGVKTYLGDLTGVNDAWAYSSFTLGSNFFDDIAAGLQIFIDIDTANLDWHVTLAKSVISTDGSAVPAAEPGATLAVPEPWTVALMGLSLAGLGLIRRNRQA